MPSQGGYGGHPHYGSGYNNPQGYHQQLNQSMSNSGANGGHAQTADPPQQSQMYQQPAASD